MQNYFGDKVQTNGTTADPFNVNSYTRKATKGDRLANYFIDYMASNAISGLATVGMVVLTASLADKNSPLLGGIGMFVSFVLYIGLKIGYYVWFEFNNGGRTLGKLATGTYAVREDQSPLTLQDAFLRAICRFIPLEVFSGLTNAPWHDSLTRTMVIKR